MEKRVVLYAMMALTIVQGCVHFVHHKKWRRMIRMNCEKESKRSDSLFTTAQLFHIAKAFHRRHRVEFHTAFVRFFGVIQAQISAASKWMFAAFRHISINRLESFVDMLVCLIEPMCTLVFDLLKACNCLPCGLFRLFKVSATLFQTLRNAGKGITGLADKKSRR